MLFGQDITHNVMRGKLDISAFGIGIHACLVAFFPG